MLGLLGHPGSRARACGFLPFPALQSALCMADFSLPPTPSFLQTSLTNSSSLLCTNILTTYFLIFKPNRLDVFPLNTHLPSKRFPCSGSPSTLHINPLLQTPTCWHPSSSLAHINTHALLANCPPSYTFTLSPLHTAPHPRSPRSLIHSDLSPLPAHPRDGVSGSPLFPVGLTFPRTHSAKIPSAESGALASQKTSSQPIWVSVWGEGVGQAGLNPAPPTIG